MAFQPFGYPFEIRSHLGVTAVKAAIRSARTDWFDVNKGPRGWIVGSYLCLWNSALHRFGPMLLARIEDDRGSIRIKGRAGSDLNGTFALIFWSLLLLPMIFAAVRDGESLNQFTVVIALMIIGLPLSLWFANKDKRDADSLVRFLQRTVALRPTDRGGLSSIDPMPIASVAIDGKHLKGVVTDSQLADAVVRLSVDSFLLLERAPHEYMQVLSRTDDFLLEKREGGADRHFQHSLSKGAGVADPQYARSERAVIAVLTDYLCRREASQSIAWKRIRI